MILIVLIGLFHTKAQSEPTVVKDSLLWDKISAIRHPFLLMFGEEHDFVSNSQVEIRWTDYLLDHKCINTILLEYDPSYVLWLKMTLQNGDSALLFNLSKQNKALQLYWKFLFKKYNGVPVEKIPIYGIDVIDNMDYFFSRWDKYAELLNNKSQEFQMLKKMIHDGSVKKRKNKSIEKIIAYVQSIDMNKNLSIEMRYLINGLKTYRSLGKKRIRLEERDTFMYENYTHLHRNVPNLQAILFVGKLHMAKTTFKLGKDKVSPLGAMIMNYNKSLLPQTPNELITILFSYEMKVQNTNESKYIKENRYDAVRRFQLSYKMPCEYIQKEDIELPEIPINSISDLMFVHNQCTDYVMLIYVEDMRSRIDFN